MSTDYFPPIQRAIANLPDNTAENRKAMYDRARNALVKQLRGMEPPLTEAQVQTERMGLEEAIQRVEQGYTPRAATAQPAPERKAAPASPVNEVPRNTQDTPPPTPRRAAKPSIPAPRRGPRDSDRPRRFVMLGAGLIAVVLLVGGAATWYFARPAPQPSPAAPVAAPVAEAPKPAAPEVVGGKIAERIGDEPAPALPQAPAPTPEAPPAQSTAEAPAAPAPSTPAPADAPAVPATAEPLVPAAPDSAEVSQVAQRAKLVEEDPSSPQRGLQLAGTVTWRTESVSSGTGAPLETAIKAEVDVPERKLRLLMTIRRNVDPVLPASHIIDLQFVIPPDFPGGGIDNVPGLLMKDGEVMTGLPLQGRSVLVTPGTFLVGLLDPPADSGLNASLMRQRSWMDIPLLYSNGRKAILSIEKGVPGDKVFGDAFAAWGTTGATTP